MKSKTISARVSAAVSNRVAERSAIKAAMPPSRNTVKAVKPHQLMQRAIVTQGTALRSVKVLQQILSSDRLVPQGAAHMYRIEVIRFTQEGPHGQRQMALTIVYDAWSTAIVGLHICPTEYCEQEKSVALLSVVHDKGTLCHYLGLRYDPRDWVEAPLPYVVEGNFPAKVASQLSITIFSHRPFDGRTDFSVADTLHQWFKNELHHIFHQSVKCTVGLLVIKWNRRHKSAIALVPAECERSPLGFLSWGLEHHPVRLDNDDIHWLFLRDQKARFTRGGLRVSGSGATLYFERDSWGAPYRPYTRFPAGAYYDPRFVSTVWYGSDARLGLTPYRLIDREHAAMSWAEVGFLQSATHDTKVKCIASEPHSLCPVQQLHERQEKV